MLRFPRRKTLPSTPSNYTSHEACVPTLNTEVFSKTNSSFYFLKPLKSVGGCSYTSYWRFLKDKLFILLPQTLQGGRRVFLHFILRFPQIKVSFLLLFQIFKIGRRLFLHFIQRFPRRKTIHSTSSNPSSWEVGVLTLHTVVSSKINSSFHFLKTLKIRRVVSYTSYWGFLK